MYCKNIVWQKDFSCRYLNLKSADEEKKINTTKTLLNTKKHVKIILAF